MYNLSELSLEIIKDLLNDIIVESKKSKEINKIVVVYSGRFQPFHNAHYEVYKHLVNKFGKNNVYIATSNKIESGKSVFNFSEKKLIMTSIFKIPEDKIFNVVYPYSPKEILNNFDPETTAYIAVVGEKDKNRLLTSSNSYFKNYDGNPSEGYINRGYVYLAPHVRYLINGQEVSGTFIRNNFSKDIFLKIYPRFDKKIYNLMKSKLLKNESRENNKQLLLCGGAAGHINHPFEDMNLTFGDLKNMITYALQGKLECVKEKIDGINLMFSWINGQLKVARNKGQVKNFGKNALNLEGIKNMFAGRGDLQVAFVEAMKDLNAAISNLPESKKKEIFENGKKFMSVEIVYPALTNVIPYNYSMLIFHGVYEYDFNGNLIHIDEKPAELLANLIKKINADVQKTFTISYQQKIELSKVKDFSAKKKYFLSKLSELQKRFNLSDSNYVIEYHLKWWIDFIIKTAKSFNYEISPKELDLLSKRWAYNDKSYKINDIIKLTTNTDFANWIKEFDKKSYIQQFKENIKPFEILFLQLGVEILKNIKEILIKNPSVALNNIKSELDKTIKQIENSNDINMINKLKQQLERLNSIGGISSILPIEGITFMYNGSIYKITGAFAPLNSIISILKFGDF